MTAIIDVQNLTVAYDDYIVMRDISFTVNRGDIFIIMGASGCGKSSLLRALTGLLPIPRGSVCIGGSNIATASAAQRTQTLRQCGILYQSGALFSAMTLAENVALPLQQQTDYDPQTIAQIVDLKLALVGLAGFNDFYPSEISGGMKKRAGLARALALDPRIVYFDEPSAGLDPLSSRALDELILNINRSLGTTIVMITHELPSLLSIGTNSIFLDAATRSIIARGRPSDLLRDPPNATVARFLTRGVCHEAKTE